MSCTDPQGYTTTKKYNLQGSCTQVNYPDGTCEMFKYDPEGSLHRHVNREKIVTVYEYDYLGRLRDRSKITCTFQRVL